MLKSLKQRLRASLLPRAILEDLQAIRLAQGSILSNQVRTSNSVRMADWEFQVFSQWGEDGIIQKLTSVVPVVNATFIEFGVEDFHEANCRFLMMHDNWSGFVVDSSERNVERIEKAPWYWKYDLRARQAYLTRENLVSVLAESGFDRDLGLLSVDVDGMDYWLLEAALSAYTPRILVVEYNAVFGAERPISIPYTQDFERHARHHSGLYYGASLAAFAHLARKHGYELVGAGSAGVNAFFVRADVLPSSLRPVSVPDAYRPARFRQSRDAEGKLNYLRGSQQLDAIRGLPVVNVETQGEEKV